MSFLLNPYLYVPEPTGSFELIETLTAGSGGTSEFLFSGIPNTYQNLQLRVQVKSTHTTNPDLLVRINGGSTAIYSRHGYRGNGSATTAYASSSLTYGICTTNFAIQSSVASKYGVALIEILDYAETTKNTMLRIFYGSEAGTFGETGISSVMWANTAAVTSISLYPEANSFAEYSNASLYGMKDEVVA